MADTKPVQPGTKNSRRQFLQNVVAAGSLSLAMPSLLQAAPFSNREAGKAGDGFTFLFQGDSITDGNRTRNNDWNHVMGHGYAYLIASRTWYNFPAKGFHFFNRGVSGNKITDLAQRWQADTLDIKPDLLSILIGINDVSSAINGNKDFTAEQYETGYRELLQKTKEQLPAVQFVLCEPFILPVGKIKDKWELYRQEISKRQAAVKRLSAEFNAIYVELQGAFNNALSKAPAEYWIWDGIHPMPAGHELVAREWLQQVTRKLKFIKHRGL